MNIEAIYNRLWNLKQGNFVLKFVIDKVIHLKSRINNNGCAMEHNYQNYSEKFKKFYLIHVMKSILQKDAYYKDS